MRRPISAADAPGLSFEESTFCNVACTTGTTSGKHSPFFNTTHDQYYILKPTSYSKAQ